MECIICGKSNEKSVCSDCESKKRCKECNILKTDFYKYKNGKLYSTCIECFNKKVICEFCNKEFNKTYLSKHLKRCIINHDNNNYTNNEIINHNENHDNNNYTNIEIVNHNENYENNNYTNNEIINHNENHDNNIYTNNIITNDNNDNIDTATLALHNNCNRTLINGPSFCGKTLLLLNKLQLIRVYDKEKQIHIITRSPGQYENIQLEDVSVEEDLEDRTIQDFQNCCVVFDDMLDSNQKLIDPVFTRGRHNDLDVYYLSQSYFDLPKRTIRNNSNFIILFQQTLKDVEHIYRDIAGFDMSYDEFKSLCREAWRDTYNYLLINWLEDKKGCKYMICNESNLQYQIFNPQTDPF